MDYWARLPVAIIVYITLIIFDRIECFYSLTNTRRERAKRASAPERIFSCLKNVIFLYGLLQRTPSAIIVKVDIQRYFT